jgi:hypothetical protein
LSTWKIRDYLPVPVRLRRADDSRRESEWVMSAGKSSGYDLVVTGGTLVYAVRIIQRFLSAQQGL